MRSWTCIQVCWLASALVATFPLNAQALGLEGGPDRWPGFLRVLAADPEAMVFLHPVVLEGADTDWSARMQAAFGEDSLLDWQAAIPVVLPGESSGEGAEGFRRTFRWASGPHWGLFDGQGRLLVHGDRPPTAGELLEALQGARVPSRVALLDAFCRKHPGQQEAQAQLTALSLRGAQIRTGRLKGEGPLDPETDERIWGRAAKDLDRFLSAGEWRNGLVLEGSGWGSREGGRSGCLAAVLRRHLPDLEAQLRRMPDSRTLWGLWTELRVVRGESPIGPWLASLDPLPGRARPWSDSFILQALSQACRSEEDWSALARLLQPVWADIRGDDPFPGKVTDPMAAALDQQTWREGPERLLRALLKARRPSEAEQVLRQAQRWWPEGGVPARAAKVALECGEGDLARRWARLPPPLPGDPEEEPQGKAREIPVPEPAGKGGRIQGLDVFVRQHPGHAQALQALAEACLEASAHLTGVGKGSEVAAALSPAEDLRIWGRSVALLERLFRSGEWAWDGVAWMKVSLEAARRSVLMGDLARRRIGDVEEALCRQPSCTALWRVWEVLGSLLPSRSVQPLLDRLVPAPGASSWPPPEAVAALVREQRGRGAWRETLALLLPRWEQEARKIDPDAGALEMGSLRSDALWEPLLSPLLEAALRQGDLDLADRILGEHRALLGGTGLANRAVALATACGRVDVAARWALGDSGAYSKVRTPRSSR